MCCCIKPTAVGQIDINALHSVYLVMQCVVLKDVFVIWQQRYCNFSAGRDYFKWTAEEEEHIKTDFNEWIAVPDGNRLPSEYIDYKCFTIA